MLTQNPNDKPDIINSVRDLVCLLLGKFYWAHIEYERNNCMYYTLVLFKLFIVGQVLCVYEHIKLIIMYNFFVTIENHDRTCVMMKSTTFLT